MKIKNLLLFLFILLSISCSKEKDNYVKCDNAVFNVTNLTNEIIEYD